MSTKSGRGFSVVLDRTYDLILDLKALDWFRAQYGRGIFSALQDPDPKVAILIILAGLRHDPRFRILDYEKFRDHLQAWLDATDQDFSAVTRALGQPLGEFLSREKEGAAAGPLALGDFAIHVEGKTETS
jgi:hypothetical protein